MPDANGFPTAVECTPYIESVTHEEVPQESLALLQRLLEQVIAHFQSPVGKRGQGGTGRRFEQVTETRYYDGQDEATLIIDDVMPGTITAVTLWGSTVLDYVLQRDAEEVAWNRLVRKDGQGMTAYPRWVGSWPLGIQNVGVTATFGVEVTDDIREAIAQEVAYKALVAGEVGINGTGQEIQIGNFSTSTAVGAMNWRASSPLGVYHDTYLDTLKAYRVKMDAKRQRLRFGMS